MSKYNNMTPQKKKKAINKKLDTSRIRNITHEKLGQTIITFVPRGAAEKYKKKDAKSEGSEKQED